VVAAKSLLATALAAPVALAFAPVAPAASPTVRITGTGQARALAALLQRSDFGAGWQGGQTHVTPLTPPSCPGFDPRQSDLVVTGHADARFTFAPADVVLEQDVEVLSSAAEVKQDFARTITPGLGPCLAYQIERTANVVSAKVERIPFPSTGAASAAAYRATVVFRGVQPNTTVLSDFVFFAQGRVEYSFNVIAPLETRSQLLRFELAIAQVIVKRAGSS
jgi:hypothetical protein